MIMARAVADPDEKIACFRPPPPKSDFGRVHHNWVDFNRHGPQHKMVKKWHEMAFPLFHILTNIVDVGHSVSDPPGHERPELK